MFSRQQKSEIAMKVQAILQEMAHDELPIGEVQFILHVDGAESWSWANIRNFSVRDVEVPEVLVQNLSSSTPVLRARDYEKDRDYGENVEDEDNEEPLF